MRNPASFGARLQRQREQRGISLRSIADSTKVSASYFAGLERGDCSRWPAGVYSRAFVRGYAEAIGLDPDTVASDFFQCFPQLGMPPAPPTSAPVHATVASHPAVASTRGELRLVLVDSPADRAREQTARLWRVLIEVAAVLLVAAIVGAANGRFWMALSVALVTRQIVSALTVARGGAIDTLAKDDEGAQAALPDAELAEVR